MVVKPKCVPTAGHQDEAKQLERLGTVKGYWLGWKMFEKQKD